MNSFTKKTVGGKLSKSFDSLMEKGMDLLDAGMEVLDEVFSDSEKELSRSVTTTIRIRLTPERITDLQAGKAVTFKVDDTTIRIERIDERR